MLEFLFMVFVTLIVVSLVTLAIRYGKSPIYSPDQAHVETLLTRLMEQQLSDIEWEFFVEMPIVHDPDLERIRERCQQVQQQHGIRSKEGHARLKEDGYIVIRHLLRRLQNAGSRSF